MWLAFDLCVLCVIMWQARPTFKSLLHPWLIDRITVTHYWEQRTITNWLLNFPAFFSSWLKGNHSERTNSSLSPQRNTYRTFFSPLYWSTSILVSNYISYNCEALISGIEGPPEVRHLCSLRFYYLYYFYFKLRTLVNNEHHFIR